MLINTYICICIYAHIYIYTCIYIYVCTHIHSIYVCTYIPTIRSSMLALSSGESPLTTLQDVCIYSPK